MSEGSKEKAMGQQQDGKGGSLDQQLIDIADKHGASYIGIALYTLADGTRFFGVGVHAGKITASDSLGEVGTIGERLSDALALLHAKRADLSVPELAGVEVAA